MRPRKESRHEKCSWDGGRCCYSPPRGSSSWKSPGLPVCSDTGMMGTRPVHQRCKLVERTLGRKQPHVLFLCSLLHLDVCMYKGGFCAAEGYIFHFCLAGSIGNSRRKRGQQKLLCRLTWKESIFPEKLKKSGGEESKNNFELSENIWS